MTGRSGSSAGLFRLEPEASSFAVAVAYVFQREWPNGGHGMRRSLQRYYGVNSHLFYQGPEATPPGGDRAAISRRKAC